MQNKTLWLFYSAITFAPSLGWAVDSNLSGLNVGELAIVQSQTILFKAQAERAKAEQSINGEVNPVNAEYPLGNIQPTTASVRNAETQQGLPVVKAVFGSGKRLHATLLYSSGFEVDADSSSRELPGGYHVVTLTVDNVTVERGGKRFPLGFSNRPPPPSSDTYNPTSHGPPSLPNLPGLIPSQR